MARGVIGVLVRSVLPRCSDHCFNFLQRCVERQLVAGGQYEPATFCSLVGTPLDGLFYLGHGPQSHRIACVDVAFETQPVSEFSLHLGRIYIAAGGTAAVHNVGRAPTGTSVIAPALLFEEVELFTIEEEREGEPIVTAPHQRGGDRDTL